MLKSTLLKEVDLIEREVYEAHQDIVILARDVQIALDRITKLLETLEDEEEQSNGR